MARDDGRRHRGATTTPTTRPTHDPHCTCPDCIADHATQLGQPIDFHQPIATRHADEPAPDWYKLPDGSIVPTDSTATKGAGTIDYTLRGGHIVQALRVLTPASELSPADRQRQHLDTFEAPGLTPAQAAGFGPRTYPVDDRMIAPMIAPIVNLDLMLPDLTGQTQEITRRTLAARMAELITEHSAAIVLEALADALTVRARENGGDATGPDAALAVLVEQAREYAQERSL
jgi:hypothetical protein